jgi:2-desacetyl-2-hydroxyethyl bacteriochlorophyllide A dehydrogenase
MQTVAVVLDGPQQIAVRNLALNAVRDDDVVIDVSWSGISTGTERLLWSGRMPPFPGMGYPLVPGYESVGRVVDAGVKATHRIGENVFIPGATCYRDARGLFEVRVLAPDPMVAQVISVVAPENDDCIFSETEIIEYQDGDDLVARIAQARPLTYSY